MEIARQYSSSGTNMQEAIIKKLCAKGMSEEEIADLLEISAEQVKEVSQRCN